MVMKFYKKLLAFFIAWVAISMLNFSYASIPGWESYEPGGWWKSSPKVGWETQLDVEKWIKNMSEDFGWIIQTSEKSSYDKSVKEVMELIQIVINWLLAILATVAFIVILYNGFLILSAWSDDKNSSKGKNWLKTAAIALMWILLSRLIISVIIWFIKLMATS